MNNFYNRPGTKKRGSFIFKSLFCFFLSTLFLSCSASKENELNQLLKTEWKLVKLYEEDLSSLSKSPTLIFFNETEAGGNTGCNSFSGEYVIVNKEILFSKMISTKMFCDGRMEIENKYLTALTEINKLQLSEEELILLKDDDPILIFKK